jgi:cobalt-zinc-cadmium resistance protein CzcA
MNQQVAEATLRYEQQQLESQLKQLQIQYDKAQTSLAYYEKTALPQADLILYTASKSYQAGEIEYIEFVQNITQAWQIKEMYLSELQNVSQLIIDIETLIGNE